MKLPAFYSLFCAALAVNFAASSVHAVPQRKSTARPSAPAGQVCPQSLFKVHPDNDDLFARVLASNPNATLVMFDGRHQEVTGRFMRRLARAFDRQGVSVERQLIVLPAVPPPYVLPPAA